MDPLNLQVPGWVLTLIASVITALLTAKISLHRFYSEKWWERKSAAYVTIIESLHHMSEDFDANLMAYMEHREINEDRKAELKACYKVARAEVSKHIDIGEILISEEVVKSLRRLVKELGKRHDDYFDDLDESLGAVMRCLREVRTLARADLKLDPWWRRWIVRVCSISRACRRWCWIWLLASLIWIVATPWLFKIPFDLLKATDGYCDPARFQRLCLYLHSGDLDLLSELAVMPPLGVLAVTLILWWIWRRFRSRSASAA